MENEGASYVVSHVFSATFVRIVCFLRGSLNRGVDCLVRDCVSVRGCLLSSWNGSFLFMGVMFSCRATEIFAVFAWVVFRGAG